jgi:hypothetical protein
MRSLVAVWTEAKSKPNIRLVWREKGDAGQGTVAVRHKKLFRGGSDQCKMSREVFPG